VRRGNRLSGWDDRLIEGFLDLLSRVSEGARKNLDPRAKFVGFYELLKLLEKPGCPVCSIIQRSLHHYLNVVFVEQLTAPEFREPLQESLGYCPRHSETLRRVARKKLPRMGVAVVYEDLLGQVDMRLEKQGVVPIPSNCPLCSIETDLEEYAVHLVADYSDDQEFQRHYLASDGICLPHLQLITAKLEAERAQFLFTAQKQNLDRLLAEVHEFIRKQDHRYSMETMTEAEASSWKRAVQFFVGD
jgi:hypothetical protein